FALLRVPLPVPKQSLGTRREGEGRSGGGANEGAARHSAFLSCGGLSRVRQGIAGASTRYFTAKGTTHGSHTLGTTDRGAADTGREHAGRRGGAGRQLEAHVSRAAGPDDHVLAGEPGTERRSMERQGARQCQGAAARRDDGRGERGGRPRPLYHQVP